MLPAQIFLSIKIKHFQVTVDVIKTYIITLYKTAYSVCDSISNSTSYTFGGYDLTLSCFIHCRQYSGNICD